MRNGWPLLFWLFCQCYVVSRGIIFGRNYTPNVPAASDKHILAPTELRGEHISPSVGCENWRMLSVLALLRMAAETIRLASHLAFDIPLPGSTFGGKTQEA